MGGEKGERGERERERDRQTDRQTDRHLDLPTKQQWLHIQLII